MYIGYRYEIVLQWHILHFFQWKMEPAKGCLETHADRRYLVYLIGLEPTAAVVTKPSGLEFCLIHSLILVCQQNA